MKKIFGLFLILIVLNLICLGTTAVSAATSVSADVVADAATRTVEIRGKLDNGGVAGRYTACIVKAADSYSDISVSNVSEKVYGLATFNVGENGEFSHTFKVPKTMKAGDYKVVVGGINDDTAYDDRSFEFYYEGEMDQSFWIEAENCENISGKYVRSVYSPMSGGAYFRLISTTVPEVHTLTYDFDVEQKGDYDVWILSTDAKASYVSRFKWNIDGGDFGYCDYVSVSDGSVKTADGVELRWHKLSKNTFDTGSHSLSIRVDESRATGTPCYVHYFDAIAIAPSNWGWEPYKIGKPYNRKNVKVELKGASVQQTNVMQDGYIDVTVNNTLLEAVDGDPRVYAQLLWNGEVVATGFASPSVPMSSRELNKVYSDTVRVQVPFDCPDAICEVRVGVGLPDTIAYTNATDRIAGQVYVGTARDNEEKISPRFVSVDVPETIVANRKLNVSATVSLNRSVNFDTKPYVALWKGDVLHAVLESEKDIETSKWTRNTAYEVNFACSIENSLPAGTYELRVGLHKMGESNTLATVNVTGTTNTESHKPLSKGSYFDKKSGETHFWYINKEGTNIWDGEPYIPMGGMVCPRYITLYSETNVASNRQGWEMDKVALEEMRANGITDIYILARGTDGARVPPKAWQWLCDNLNEMGFVFGIQCGVGNYREMETYYIRANNSSFNKSIRSGGAVSLEVDSSELEKMGTAEYLGGEYVVLKDSTSEAVAWGECSLVEVADNKIRFDADVSLSATGSFTIYFTPKVKKTPSTVMNHWENGDEILKTLSDFASNVDFGSNFRLFVDPLGNESGYYNQIETIRPASDAYDGEFAKWLEDKYSDVVSLNDSWIASPQLPSFAVASRLIPLCTGEQNTSGVYYTYARDRVTGDLYKLNSRQGVMWNDNLDFKSEYFMDFNNQAADSLKSGADVPVVVKNVWGYKSYFVNKEPSGGIDGMGCEAYGTYDVIGGLVANNYSMNNQFARTAWNIVTETAIMEDIQTFYESGRRGYETEEYMNGHHDTLFEHGAKGIYDFVIYAPHDKRLVAYSYVDNPQQYEWLENYKNEKFGGEKTEALAKYVPKKTKVHMLGDEQTYFVYPNRITSVLYDDAYKLIRQSYVTENKMVMQTVDAFVDTDMLVANFADGPASVTFGKDFGNMLETKDESKKAVYLGTRNDLGTVPQLDKYFTDSFSTVNGNRVQILNPTATSEVLATTSKGKPWALRDGTLWIIASEGFLTSDKKLNFIDEYGVAEAVIGISTADESLKKVVGTRPQTVSSLTAGDYVFTANATNNANVQKSLFAVVAVYDNQRLETVITEKFDVPAMTTADIEKTFNIPSAGENHSVKCMLWDENTAPLFDGITLKR